MGASTRWGAGCGVVNAAPIGCSALLGAATNELGISRSDADSIRRAWPSRARPLPRDGQPYRMTLSTALVPARRRGRNLILPHLGRRRKPLSYGPGERRLLRLRPSLPASAAVQVLLCVRPNSELGCVEPQRCSISARWACRAGETILPLPTVAAIKVTEVVSCLPLPTHPGPRRPRQSASPRSAAVETQDDSRICV